MKNVSRLTLPQIKAGTDSRFNKYYTVSIYTKQSFGETGKEQQSAGWNMAVVGDGFLDGSLFEETGDEIDVLKLPRSVGG